MDTKQIQDPLESTDSPADFMIVEYEALRTFRQDLISLNVNRFNLFLGVLSGAVVFLAWINQLSEQPEIVHLVTGAVVVGVFLLGLTTFRRIASGNGLTIRYTRGLNRIRRYFVEQHPHLGKCIILPISDDQPSFKPFNPSDQLPTMLAIINSIVAGTSVSVLARVLLAWPNVAMLSVGLGLSILSFIVHRRYYGARVKERPSVLEVHFPAMDSLAKDEMSPPPAIRPSCAGTEGCIYYRPVPSLDDKRAVW